MSSTRGSTPPNPNFNLPNRSTDLNKTLGIVGHLMRSLLPSFCPPQLAKSRVIEEIPPRTSLTLEHRKPKIEPLNLRIWEGNQREKNHKGFTRISLIKYPRARSRNTLRKPPREGSKNHHQEHLGTTQQGLEDPR
jgi:hypothetical protein